MFSTLMFVAGCSRACNVTTSSIGDPWSGLQEDTHTVGGNNIATLGKNKAMPFLPQPKCPAEWWSSNLINKIIKNHRKITKNLKLSKIQSRRNFRPKFEVGLWSSKNATTDRVALFFPPTVAMELKRGRCLAKD